MLQYQYTAIAEPVLVVAPPVVAPFVQTILPDVLPWDDWLIYQDYADPPILDIPYVAMVGEMGGTPPWETGHWQYQEEADSAFLGAEVVALAWLSRYPDRYLACEPILSYGDQE